MYRVCLPACYAIIIALYSLPVHRSQLNDVFNSQLQRSALICVTRSSNCSESSPVPGLGQSLAILLPGQLSELTGPSRRQISQVSIPQQEPRLAFSKLLQLSLVKKKTFWVWLLVECSSCARESQDDSIGQL
jgi:hypothetical protein